MISPPNIRSNRPKLLSLVVMLASLAPLPAAGAEQLTRLPVDGTYANRTAACKPPIEGLLLSDTRLTGNEWWCDFLQVWEIKKDKSWAVLAACDAQGLQPVGHMRFDRLEDGYAAQGVFVMGQDETDPPFKFTFKCD